MTGKVYLVGAGPGDADLLTVKAVKVLAAADVVVYDRLVSAEVLGLVKAGARLVYAGKQPGEQEAIQYAIHEWLLEGARAGQTVVRLKSGDPMIFGRGAEEVAFLAGHGVDVEVVPGVSSATAFSSLTGIPLTYRGVAASFAVIAGHRQSTSTVDWRAYGAVDTLVVLMGVEGRKAIAEGLIGAGRPASQPVAFVERLSTERERIVESTLGAVAAGRCEVESPAIFVIGEAVRLRNARQAAVAAEVGA